MDILHSRAENNGVTVWTLENFRLWDRRQVSTLNFARDQKNQNLL